MRRTSGEWLIERVSGAHRIIYDVLSMYVIEQNGNLEYSNRKISHTNAVSQNLYEYYEYHLNAVKDLMTQNKKPTRQRCTSSGVIGSLIAFWLIFRSSELVWRQFNSYFLLLYPLNCWYEYDLNVHTFNLLVRWKYCDEKTQGWYNMNEMRS